jgi:hypothetical protein
MDQLDQAIQVFCRDSLVLLVEVVDVAVEDLNEEFDRHGGVHAGVSDAEGALETLEDAFAVAVELGGLVREVHSGKGLVLHFWCPRRWCLRRLRPPSGAASGSGSPTRGDSQGRPHGTGLAS